MTKDEALKLALEALEEAWYHVGTFQPTEKAIDLYDEARNAIKEALAESEHGWTPERIAGMARLKEAQDKRMSQSEQPKVRTGNCLRVGVCASEGHKIAPQRTWVGLTDGEVDKMILLMGFPPDWITENAIVKNIVRNLEAKLKEKNT